MSMLSRRKLKVLKVSNVKHKVIAKTIIFHNKVRAHINGDNNRVRFDRENGNQMMTGNCSQLPLFPNQNTFSLNFCGVFLLFVFCFLI